MSKAKVQMGGGRMTLEQAHSAVSQFWSRAHNDETTQRVYPSVASAIAAVRTFWAKRFPGAGIDSPAQCEPRADGWHRGQCGLLTAHGRADVIAREYIKLGQRCARAERAAYMGPDEGYDDLSTEW